MSSWTDEYVRFLASFTDAPELYSRFMAWSILGATLGGQVNPIGLAAEDLRPNFWTILVGPSGEARKSTQLKIARRMVGKVDRSLSAPVGGSYVGVLEHMQANPHIFFVFDEFRRFMQWLATEYNREAKSFFTEIYDWPFDEDWVASRAAGRGTQAGRDNSVRISGPMVSMAQGSTESWLTGSVGRSDMVSGFLVRFLLVPYPGKEREFAFPPDRDRNWESRLTKAVADVRAWRWRYKVTSCSREAYQQWFNKVKSSKMFHESVVLQPYFHRMTVYAWKICMVEAIGRHILDCEHPYLLQSDDFGQPNTQVHEVELTIDRELMEFATGYLDLTLEPLVEMFEDSLVKGRFQEQQRDVIEILKNVAAQHGFIDRSTLMRKAGLKRRELDDVIEAMVEARRLIVAVHRTGQRGRQPMQYRLLRRGEDYDAVLTKSIAFWDQSGKKSS